MGLINRAIPNLFNGVSQQPASLRHSSQCELQENYYPSIATGLRKRPPTKHLAKLRNTAASDAYVHTINRDTVERYKVIMLDGDLEVYDLATGTLKTVSFPDGKAYLDCATPREDFALVTIADYTFIVNKTKVTAMTAAVSSATLSGTKQRFSDLAAPTGAGARWKIAGDPSNNFDNYYVTDTGSSTAWIEDTGPSVSTTIDAATMPHKLVRESDGTFTFSKLTWDTRKVGDDVSNPIPSFIGRKIRDLFLYRNRLGLIADENIILSRVGELYNFWAETVTAVLDSDPIDATVSHTKVSILQHALPFNKVLMLFSDQTQFQIAPVDTLSPKTIKLDVVTEFESTTACRPTGVGRELFFAVERGNFTGLREYYVETDSVGNDAADVTAHVPAYVPGGAFKLASSTIEDVVFAACMNERNAIYAYKFYWGKDEKVQSAWSKFTFDADDVILNMDFIGPVCYLTIQRSDGIYLESMDLQPDTADGTLGFEVLLDRRTELTGVYDAGNDWTTWTLPYEDDGDIRVVLGEAFGSQNGSSLNVTRPTSSTVRATGDYSAGDAYVGRAYTARYRFSEQFVKDAKNSTIASGTLKMRSMSVAYQSSGYFRVEVTPKARDTYTYPFTGKLLGAASLLLGKPTLETGTFRFPVSTDSHGVTIDLVNDSHLPSTFQSAEWEAEFIVKSQRM